MVLAPFQAMQDFSLEASLPPHTTSLPPDRRERLGLRLGPGKSGMEHVSMEGRGKISTDERRPSSDKRRPLLFKPPTTNCPDAKIVKDKVE